MTLLSTDTFNRADGALGSTDGAGSLDPLAWAQDLATLSIASNTMRALTNNGAGLASATVNLGTGDVDISLTVTTIGTETGIVFRSNGTDFYAWFNNSLNTTKFYQYSTGTFAQIGSTHSGAAANDVLRAVAVGTSVAVYRNGVQLETTTSSFNQTSAKHGSYFSNTTGRVDSWTASSAATTTVTGTQATETDTATSGALFVVRSGIIQFIPAVTTA